MEEIKLTEKELDSLREDSYFRGTTIMSLKEIRGHISRIDKHLEISNGTVVALMKRQQEFGIRQENIAVHTRIHLALILIIIGTVVKMSFF